MNQFTMTALNQEVLTMASHGDKSSSKDGKDGKEGKDDLCAIPDQAVWC